MKTIIKNTAIVAFIFMLSVASVKSQTVNWAGLEEKTTHIINVNFGLDNGMVYGLGYGHLLNIKQFHLMVHIEYSFPSGNKLFDDHKTKIGADIMWFEFQNVRFSTKIQGVYRRYENSFVRLVNFGSDLSGSIGYYKSKWFAAAEIGFDKAIVTNFKHSAKYKDIFPAVVDGWYEPATGGIFYYGIQAGYSMTKHDVYLRGGNVLNQDFKTKPFTPFYAEIGYNYKLN